MSYEWDNSIQGASFQNSSFPRRGGGGGGGGGRGNYGGGRGNYNNFNNFNRSDRGGGERRQNFGGRGRFDQDGAGGGGRQFDGNAKMIKIPSKFVGRVIGRGGSKINDLQYESGAKIIVTKEQDENETIIKLIGSDDEVNRAEELIRDLTVERDSFRSAPGHGGYEDSGSQA